MSVAVSRGCFIPFGNCFIGKIKKYFCLLLWLVVIWSIWLTRNEILFKGGHKGEYEIAFLAKKLSWKWFGAKLLRPFVFDLEDWYQNPISCFP